MSKDGARASRQSESLQQQLAALATQFGDIAAAIECGPAESLDFARDSTLSGSRRAETALADAFAKTRDACRAAAIRSSEAQPLLRNLTTALEAWRTVWPRLGQQREFRQAVVREARMWQHRFQELARSTVRS